MAETYADYFRGLARSAGQGVTFGFGDELEAAIRAIGPETYGEEVAKIRADIAKFQETNPYSAFGAELAGAIPASVAGGAGLASLGVRGIGKIGAIEGALYGAGTGEDAASRAVGAAIGAPVGAVAGKVGETVTAGIAPLIGRAMKARGAGAETRGSGEALMKEPVTTVKAYKLFKMDKDGGLHPLFVKMGDKQPLPVGKWIDAEAGELNPSTGKVKSSIGDLAYRPGFHAGDLPIATHIGGKVDPLTGERVKGSMKPNIREDNQVWAEVEMPADVDWQRIADSRARIMKSGKPDPKTAHITDELPMGGFYRYKTNPNMEGNWLISGQMKINRLLSDDEVRSINTAAGTADLPRLSELMSQGRGPSATVYDYETGTVYPLEKTVGEPRTSELGPGGINPVTKDPLLGPFTADYSPIENALANAERVMNASPTKGLTGAQYLARLPEQPSVTKTEMNASGLASFLAKPENKNRKIPVAEVQQYLKENAPDIETFKYTADNNDVSYRDTQRFMDESAYSELGYGEITVNNRNAHPATSGHMLSHYRDQLGNFAHIRYSDHKDASGGVSRVIEENQFDLLQSLLARERGERGFEKIPVVKLTPEKVAEYDARIEKLRGSSEYALREQAGDKMTTASAKEYDANSRLTGMQKLIDDFETDLDNKILNGRTAFTEAGEENTLGLTGQKTVSPTVIDSQIANSMPDFINGLMNDALRYSELETFNESQIKNIISRAVSKSPKEIRDEIFERAQQRTGKNPLARLPSNPTPKAVNTAAQKVGRMEDRIALRVSMKLDDAIFDFHKNRQDVFGEEVLALQEQTAARLRPIMQQSMSGRMLDVTAKNIAKDIAGYNSNINQKLRFQDDIKKHAKARNEAAKDYESHTLKMLDGDNILEDLQHGDSARMNDAASFVEYAQKTNFLSKQSSALATMSSPIKAPQLVPNQPFETPLQAARHNIMVAIQDARSEGVDRIYFPDYRDIAKIREINPEGFIKSVYKDAPEKVIKELKQKFPNLKTGRISPDDFVGDHLSEISDEARVDHPVLYLDISRDSIDKLGIPRRYAKGGQVDLRSGIGDMFRLYS